MEVKTIALHNSDKKNVRSKSNPNKKVSLKDLHTTKVVESSQ